MERAHLMSCEENLFDSSAFGSRGSEATASAFVAVGGLFSSKVSSIVAKAILAVFVALALSLIGTHMAFAAPQTIKISSISFSDGPEVVMSVELPSNLYFDSLEIHRTTSASNAGDAPLYESLERPFSWVSYGNGDWFTYGNKTAISTASTANLKKIKCYDSGVSVGKTYYYKIALKNDDGEVLAISDVKSVTVKLASPVIFSAYAKTNTSAVVKWLAPTGAKGYVVEQKYNGKWKKVKTISKASTTKMTKTGLKKSKTYYYRVKAYKKVSGKTIYSDVSQQFKVKMKNPSVKGKYTTGSIYGPSLSKAKLTEVRRVVQGFKDNYIKSGMPAYKKAYAAFEFLRNNCSYAWKGWQYHGANTAWGALVYGEAQCSGYARAYKALCDAIGVPCYYVHANNSSVNPSHQWNIVKISGKAYIVDPQGGFFLVGSKTYKATGMRWSSKGLPTVKSSDYSKGGIYWSEM